MRIKGWSRQCLVNYVLIQTPFAALFLMVLLILKDWLDFSGWIAWAGFLAWLLKDIILFFVLWPAYEPHQGEGRYSLQGKTGTARTWLDPEGLIRIRAEIWKARLAPGQAAVSPGQTVQVVKRQGLVLIVRAV